jgi:hypothetical protein
VRNSGGGSVSRGRRKGNAAGERGGLVGFVAAPRLQKRRKRKEKGMVTAAPRMAGGERSGAPWRAQERTPGKGRGRVTRGERAGRR